MQAAANRGLNPLRSFVSAAKSPLKWSWDVKPRPSRLLQVCGLAAPARVHLPFSAPPVCLREKGGVMIPLRTHFGARPFSLGEKVSAEGRRMRVSARDPSSGRAIGRSSERPSFDGLWRVHLPPEGKDIASSGSAK